MTEQVRRVEYSAVTYGTKIPGRYQLQLYVNGIFTGVAARVWGRRKARELAEYMIQNGNQVLHDFEVVDQMLAALNKQDREVAMSKLKVGDKVRLWIDLGIYKKGRVCTVVEVEEPSRYVSRGVNAWNENRFPIKVVPVSGAGEAVLGTKEGIPLAAGEFGALNEEVPE